MKTLLKYGLFIAVGAIAWVVVVHYVVTNPTSIVHQLGTPIVFNVLQFAMIYLGIKAVERERGERLTFKEGIQTGFGISFIYGIALSVFFGIVLAVMGTKWMAVEPGDAPSSIIVRAFVGLFLSALVFGLIYSTVISFFITKRQSEQ